MMSKIKGKLMLLALTALPLNAMAHAGHDHQSQWAMLVHLLWLAPAGLAIYLAVSFFNKRKSNNAK